MPKVVLIGSAARDKLIAGANFLADAVKMTLGPFGANAAIEKGNRVTNDGVTIAREIELKDEIENRGVTILREAAIKTNEQAGDGTTTAITLAQAILQEATKILANSKTFVGRKTPAEVIRIIDTECKEVIARLDKMAVPINSREDLVNSAKVSVEDEELAELIGNAQWEVGKMGRLVAEETIEFKSSVEKIHGIRIDNGVSTTILMNNPEKQTLEVENVRTILTNHTLLDLKPVATILDQLSKQGVRNIVVVARAFSRDAILACHANCEKGFNIYPMNAPYTDQNEIFKDLEAVLGGRYINQEEGELTDMMISDIGSAKKIIGERFNAIFTGENNDKSTERIAKRVIELKKKLSGNISLFEKNLLEERIAQLDNGFALVKIGATSDAERKWKKDKAEDAVNAVRAAFQEGTVAGGGLAFKEISESLPDTYILKRPLTSIYQQIISNAPSDFKIEDWVRDPVVVLKTALKNACSVAGTFATSGIAIATERPKPRFMEEVKTQDERDN